MIDVEKYPALHTLLDHQLKLFPKHRPYFAKRFRECAGDHLALSNEISDQVIKIANGHLDEVLSDYDWLTQVVLEEELHFRRTGGYRLSSFEEAESTVYADPVYMRRYMNGLLVSQVWWSNHAGVIGFYRDEYLPSLPEDFRHLEIGPGHGLFLYQAARAAQCGCLTGWDISETSLAMTREALGAMNVDRPVALSAQNIFEAPEGEFDSITFSEVLEHLEQPLEALKILRSLQSSRGRIFINAPVNSPAPDHLYLFRTPEEIIDMTVAAGFEVLSVKNFPSNGVTLEDARRRCLAISTAIIAQPKQKEPLL